VTNNEYRDLYRNLSTGADVLAGFLPGPAGLVAKFLSRAFALGADFISAGKDPAIHIRALPKRAPLLAELSNDLEAEEREKFGSPAVPTGPDTLPDIYEPDED
jgi:hypothetical protein